MVRYFRFAHSLSCFKYRYNILWFKEPSFYTVSRVHTTRLNSRRTYFIILKIWNNIEVTNSKCYAFASSELLRLFFTSNFIKDDKYLTLPEVFFNPLPLHCVGLATALLVWLLITQDLSTLASVWLLSQFM